MRKSICLLLIAAGLLAAAAPALAQGTGEDITGEIDVGGVARRYLLHLPAGYDAEGAPVPLVLSFHGLASNSAQQAWTTKLSAKADAEGFIVVYPQGLGTPTRWRLVPDASRRGNDDVAFARDLIAHLQTVYTIDPARIYVTGMSNGGGISNRLACDLADVVAAVAPVAGAYGYADRCNPAQPVPVLAFHGLDDPIVLYNGTGRVAILDSALPPIHEWAEGWAARNGCDPDPAAETAVIEGTEFTVETWTNCESAGVTVILYSIDGIGHVWPGGNSILLLGPTGSVSATDVMWDFFAAHPMPSAE
jgi:polyhydroxybutyrate depolymerase